MNEILDELKQEARREKLERALMKYWPHALVFVVVLLFAVGVSNWLIQRQQHQAEVATRQLVEAATAPFDAQQEAWRALAEEHGAEDGVGILAQFNLARVAADAGEMPAARELLQTVSEDVSVGAFFRELAVLQLAQLTEDEEARMAQLKKLAETGTVWNYHARELLAHVYLTQGDMAQGEAMLQALAGEVAVPPAVRQRVQELISPAKENHGMDEAAPAALKEE